MKRIEGASARADWVVFWLLAGLYLTPVWLYSRIPTQDGISHVYNAVILRDFHEPGARYEQVFALRREQFPNWSAHLLLWGLSTLLPPLVAEKLLVSLYVVGTAAGIQLLIRTVNPRSAAIAPAALLFLYHRGFFMGFYGFCLSLLLFWFVTALSARWCGELNASRVLMLAALLATTYFTHLIGFFLSLLNVGWISLATSRRPLNSLLWLVLAASPGLLLAHEYMTSSFAVSAREAGVCESIITWQTEDLDWSYVGNELLRVNDELFGVLEPFAIAVVGPLVLLLVAFIAFAGLERVSREKSPATLVRWALAGLGGIVASFYFVLPDEIVPHGSFLQLRWVTVPPVLWLACCRLPETVVLRRTVIGAIWCVSAAQLAAIGVHFQHCHLELAEYCSAIEESGKHHLLLPIGPPSPELVDHLSHAAAYYCLTTGNVLVDNYEAYNPYFPVRFAEPPARSGRTIEEYMRTFQPEVLLLWKDDLKRLPEDDQKKYRVALRHGLLTMARHIDAR